MTTAIDHLMVGYMLELPPLSVMSRHGDRLKVLVDLRPGVSAEAITVGLEIDFQLKESDQRERMEVLTQPVRWREGQAFFTAKLTES